MNASVYDSRTQNILGTFVGETEVYINVNVEHNTNKDFLGRI